MGRSFVCLKTHEKRLADKAIICRIKTQSRGKIEAYRVSRGQQSQFYKTAAWVNCRESYLKSVGGLCEICRSKGLITPAEIVHHKVHLNAMNINNPNVTLNFDNLQALCRKHHGELHGHTKRFEVMEDGSIIPKG